MDPVGGPDNVKRVAAGQSDFCLTSVHHYITARNEEGELSCRFVAIVVQHSPLAAIVAAESALSRPADLGGSRVAAQPDNPQLSEFLATLAYFGVEGPEIVPMDNAEGKLALGRGEVDAVVGFVDGLPRTRRQVGLPVRAIPVALDVYASGLVAGEHVSPATAWKVRAAVTAALEAQRREPEAGLPELRRRYPEADVDDALEGWRLLERNIFTGVDPGSMNSERWDGTLAHLCDARGVPRLAPHSVYRPQFADVLQPGVSPVPPSDLRVARQLIPGGNVT